MPALENGLIAGESLAVCWLFSRNFHFRLEQGSWGVWTGLWRIFRLSVRCTCGSAQRISSAVRRMGIKTGLEIVITFFAFERLQADWFIFSVLPDKRSAKVHQVSLNEKV